MSEVASNTGKSTGKAREDTQSCSDCHCGCHDKEKSKAREGKDAGKDAGKARKIRKRNPSKLTSKQINAKYVGRSRSMFDLYDSLIDLYNNIEELEAMNKGKRGRPFKYTHSLISAISHLREYFSESYRACEGMMPEGKGPEYSTIFRRINRMDPSIMESLENISSEDISISLVPDGTGLTPATRSEYVRVVHKLRRGFLRLTIMINKETLEIVAFQLTDDTVGETKVFDDLLREALINMGVDPDKRRIEVREQKNDSDKTYRHIEIMADGAYDQRHIFSECEKLGVDAAMRICKTANLRADGVDGARSIKVRDQYGGSINITPAEFHALSELQRMTNSKEWKIRVRYGTRWLVEIVMSAFKRTYGDSVSARKMENIRREIKLKICTYNKMLRIGREAAMKA